MVDDRHAFLRTHVNTERLPVYVAIAVYRHQSLVLDSSDYVFNRHDAVNSGEFCSALGFSPTRRWEHPSLDDVSNREYIRRSVQTQVVVDLDETLVVESRLNHRVGLRVFERIGVRAGPRASVHLARGKHLPR